MGILAGILGTMNLWLPNLINMVELLHSKTAKSGQVKLAAVLATVASTATAAGVVDPNDKALIQAVATATINTTVAVNNAVKAGMITPAAANNSGTLAPAIATPTPATTPATR